MTQHNDNTPVLDEAAVKRLSVVIMKAIRSHYLQRPTSTQTVFEVLNALALSAAMVCAGAQDDAEIAVGWLQNSIRANLDDLLAGCGVDPSWGGR